MNLLLLDIHCRYVKFCIYLETDYKQFLVYKISKTFLNNFITSFSVISIVLQEAMMKDTLERAREPNLNLKSFLQNAYSHPVFKGEDDSDSDEAPEEFEKEPDLVPTKRQSRRNTPLPSKHSGSVPSSQREAQDYPLL
jgi:hypothetical protein